MIFSIGSLAHARAPFLVSKTSNLVSKLPTNSTGSPAHAGIDRYRGYRTAQLGSGADRIVGAIRPGVRRGDADYAAMT